jgi:tripartite-type tricarboxylate transporter receptor subunit TctC
MSDVVGGHIPLAVTSVTTVMPFYKSQKLRVLGVTSKDRSGAMPDVPTIAEAGVPGYEVMSWYVILGPKSMPKVIAERLQREVAKIVATPAMKERFDTLGAEPAAMTPDETAAIMKADMDKWAGVIQKVGIKPQ